MKDIRFLFMLLMALAISSSCTSELEDPSSSVGSVEIEKISVKMAPMLVEDIDGATRGELTDETPAGGSPVFGFVWTAGDVLGIFPNQGSQVDFPISDEYIGTSDAQFDGGGWALKAGYKYAVYFPYNYDYRNRAEIPLDYTGQKQVGSGNLSHLNDYLRTSSSNAVTATGPELDFNVSYVGSIFWFQLTMPEAGTYTKLRMRSDNLGFITKAYLNLSGDDRAIDPVSESPVMTMDLEGVSTSSAGDVIDLYMWILPKDYRGSNISVEVVSTEGKVYTASISNALNLSPKLYRAKRSPVLSETIEPEVIEFADTAVKAICVENWDTDGDGELSYDEAAAVTDLNVATTRSGDAGSVFTGNTEITSFDELSYFTGVTAIPANAFLGCESLTSVTIPENVETIGEAAFKGCWNLEEITLLPTEVPTLEGDAATVFVSTNDCPILVPEESLEAYVNEWGLYADRIDPTLEVLTNLNLIAAAEASVGQEFKNKNTDGTVTLDEVNRAIVEAVTTLNLYGKNDPTICDEISYFVNLEVLDCTENKLTSLDLSRNLALKQLYCQQNLLTELDVKNNINLVRLNCWGNQLTALDITYNTALKWLSCGINLLTSLDVSKNTALTALYCATNKLTTLDVSHNLSLTDLYCDNNQLTTLDITNNAKLVYFNCSNNQLAALDASKNVALKSLFCYGNQLTALDISPNHELNLSNVSAGNQPGELILYVNGTQYTQTLSDINNQNVTVLQKDLPEGIAFADKTVEQLCLANWDTNNDGVLTYEEAAAVADLGTVFYRKQITSFDELQYFTGLTSIGERAFNACNKLASITIPENVTAIEDYAFMSCKALTNIVIPESVTTIGNSAFFDCEKLTSIFIPKNVSSIDWSSFSSDILTNIEIDPNNTAYDSRNNCNAIIETSTNTLIIGCINTVIPNTVKVIGMLSFSGIKNLTSITIPNGVEMIDQHAFEGTGLTSVFIPASVTDLGYNPFDDCEDLVSIKVDANNPVYDSRNNCNAICHSYSYSTGSGRNLVIGCKTTVITPDITAITSDAFSGCPITSFIIPGNVKNISYFAFENCRQLTDITISEGVEFLEQCSFRNCSSLTSVTIPSTVTVLRGQAFERCSALTSITCKSTTPPEIRKTNNKGPFDADSTCPIYVPASSVDEYKTAEGWSDYADRIQAIP